MTIPEVERAIDRAQKHDSAIDAGILGIDGFSTGIQRRLISNLVMDLEGTYVEVGAFIGGTACAAINNNPNLRAYIFEDGSQPFGEQKVIDRLKENLEEFGGHGRSYTLITEDFFLADLAGIGSVEAFFYDGLHSREAQGEALPHIFDELADKFLFIVDDFDWPDVKNGTEDGFKNLAGQVDIIKHWWLTDGVADGLRYHNGIGLYLCEKR